VKLKLIGIGQNEFGEINIGFWFTMFFTTEWVYLGLWDVFARKQNRNPFYRYSGKNYYLKLMKIGLQGSGYELKDEQLVIGA